MTKYIGFIEINHQSLSTLPNQNFFKTPHNIQWKPTNFTPWTVTVPTSEHEQRQLQCNSSSFFPEMDFSWMRNDSFRLGAFWYNLLSRFFLYFWAAMYYCRKRKKIIPAQKLKQQGKNCFAIDEMVCNCFSCFSLSRISRFTSHTNYLKCFMLLKLLC